MATWSSLARALAWRAVRDPRLAPHLVRAAWRFRARGWHRRWPFLPLPARDYLRWRMLTAYGSSEAVPTPEDAVRYARWLRGAP